MSFYHRDCLILYTHAVLKFQALNYHDVGYRSWAFETAILIRTISHHNLLLMYCLPHVGGKINDSSSYVLIPDDGHFLAMHTGTWTSAGTQVS